MARMPAKRPRESSGCFRGIRDIVIPRKTMPNDHLYTASDNDVKLKSFTRMLGIT